ncbi:hypothetical protein MKEN_00379500 [Mycena kentingensis (nom. inval.)]|nr:hypothetical protein MKEN_00379500 [Mycena kentingensis (nom. inval.)]
MASEVPEHTQVLVIGGGPGGAYSAAALARDGIDVVVLEASKFPRYHIGESMLPSLRHFLRFIEAEDKVEHPARPSYSVKSSIEGCRPISDTYSPLTDQWKREGYTYFREGNHSWNVERADLDEILLGHAEDCGAQVYEEHKVVEIGFAEGSDHRPTSARYTTPTGESRTITFDYLVDASGRAGILSTKYLKNRHMNETLKNIACWGYWTGAGMYQPGTERHNSPWFEALTDESGWAWFIPLRNKVSVGIVMDGKVSAAKKAAAGGTLQDHYLAQLEFVPQLKKLLGNAELVVDPTVEEPSVRSASDYSYTATMYYGDHFRLVGDAAAFIDPFFSSGVHLAVSSGLTAAVTICASMRAHCSEEDAGKFHDSKVAISYTRFLLTVMGAYKQIRNQTVPVLSDIDENNFDRAFDLIRPVIQGTADAGKVLTEDELQKAMEFVTHIFVPTDPEMQQAVNTRLGMSLLAPTTPIFSQAQIAELAKDDEEARWVMQQANATKAVSDFYSGPERLLGEVIDGYVGCMTVGKLGLVNKKKMH